ncbi:MAG TPA: hypothetical protein VMV69_11975 [Pirellulales bacterium]|nr:hypothetical protein [Pirellulales bacterium]
MTDIVVDEQQAAIIAKAGRSVRILDPKGNIVGFVTPAPSPEEIARARKSRDEGVGGPMYTTQQVLEYLRSLEPSTP